ncbi:iron-sulfur cluster assembly protein SufD [Plasmodium brasilianum]|uniref:FeS cluster assembly protein SufD, putative n=2 Tax=Plasmodium (Plasmodium) TaxID=418103 RepID=A0A1A8W097_PLAMA|nr:FeS cluster assembly protein SufD, putative [Plasmodium malariae]KAI4838168.1 iron-sulfur cluster assembly protein SufD [Plasmodium brasilianum]SBS85063.1 FeS cluster assembly protein SufD, putative [Plasmodium malariae]SCN12563.1 FeS cluster assembly protein SufD, putative [Plasmodium malariae]
MPKRFIRNYVFVFLLLTNNFTNIFYFVENKNFNDVYTINAKFLKDIKLKEANKLKPQYKNYILKNIKKNKNNIRNRGGQKYNRNDIKKKVYSIYFNKHFENIFHTYTKIFCDKNITYYGKSGGYKKVEGSLGSTLSSYEEHTHIKEHHTENIKNVRTVHNVGNTPLIANERAYLKKGKMYFPEISRNFFINLSISSRKRRKNRSFQNYLRKYEELYKKFTPETDEEQDIDDHVSKNSHNMSNIIINEWCLRNNENKYNMTLIYDSLSNLHNNEYRDVESVNNFIKNNEIIEKQEWEEKNNPYLTYKYIYKYKNPIDQKYNFYKYEYYIPKLITYDEDISTEPKFVPSNFNSPKCYNNSPINSLTTSGFTSRNIDTFGKERNKIYSFDTPNDVKRNIYFNNLLLISSSYNQHFFSNLTFLLNLHTLQILIRDKTAIETDYIIDKFDQLKEKLIEINVTNSKKGENSLSVNPSSSEKKQAPVISSTNTNVHLNLKTINDELNSTEDAEKGVEINKNVSKKDENVKIDKIDTSKNEDMPSANYQMDEEISRHLTHKKSLFDDQIQVFKTKYSENVLEDKEFIKLWKYNMNSEIIENMNKVPLPNIYLNIDDPKYCLWKILQNSGKSAFKEIPTPNRKLEAWRQQLNLKDFYKQNFDTSISLRNISKEELINFKMKILNTSHQEDKNVKGFKNENEQGSYDKNSLNTPKQEKKKHHDGNYEDASEITTLHQRDEKYKNRNNAETPDGDVIKENHYRDDGKVLGGNEKSLKEQPYLTTNMNKEIINSSYNKDTEISKCKRKYKDAFYTLVVRDGIVDEYLSDDISILKNLNNELKKSAEKNSENENELHETSKNDNIEEKTKKSKIFVGSFFNIKDVEVEYLINKELYFIPEHSNWYKKNTQPFVRGQIGKQSRKFDNDYPIYDYRKSDFGMAKFSSLNLASIKDCAVVYLDKDIDLSDKFFHIIFISTSKNEDDHVNNKESEYTVYENAPLCVDAQDTNKTSEGLTKGEKEDNDSNSSKSENVQYDDTHTRINLSGNEKEISGKEKRKYAEKELTNYMYSPITNPRLVVYIKANSKINIYESHISLNNNNSGLVNAFSRICMEAKSNVKHTMSQELGKYVWHFHNVSVKNGLEANYKFVDILLGSKSSRVNLQIEGEKGCKQESYGLSLLEDKQNISQYEMFHHEHPYMETNQLFKFLVSEKAHAVWRSRGRIERDAIKAKLNTLCRSVLLNFGASAVAIPTLEIIPSDIEYANHGATISDLEEEPIFSLMTRGINEKIAREIIMKSFVNEILEHISDENLKERVIQKVMKFSTKYKKVPLPDFIMKKKRSLCTPSK